MRKVIFGLLFIILLVVIGLGVLNKMYNDNLDINIGEEGYKITIVQGQSVSDTIRQLVGDGVVSNEDMTKLFVKINEYNTIVADDYKFEKGTTLEEIFETFAVGQKDDIVVLQLLEGYTLEDYAFKLAQSFGDNSLSEQILAYWDSSEFVNAIIADYDVITDEILDPEIYHPLEGYFSPNTYHLPADRFNFENLDYISRFIIEQRVSDFEHAMANGAEYNEYVQTDHDALTLASVVEREALGYEDRQMVAGVFMNRLEAGDRLGSDVTTYYGIGLGLNERDLTVDDLATVNGYNTRGSKFGLPVGPVNNPSASSLDAVYDYIDTDYYYFVSDKNGKMYYNETLAKHNATIKYLKENDLWFNFE